MTEIPTHPRHRPWPPMADENWQPDGQVNQPSPDLEKQATPAPSSGSREWIYAAAIGVIWLIAVFAATAAYLGAVAR